MKIITYKRVSTSQQGISGLGLESQQRDLDLYLKTYAPNADVIGEYTDIASGGNNFRVEYLKAVEQAEKTGALLLVAKVDRISRDVELIANLIKRVSLKVCNIPHADNFMIHLFASLGEQERSWISIRTKAALQSKKDRGEDFNNPHNFKKPEVLAKSHATIKYNAKQWRDAIMPLILPIVEATPTYKAACIILNSQNIRTARGGKFHPTTITRLLAAATT